MDNYRNRHTRDIDRLKAPSIAATIRMESYPHLGARGGDNTWHFGTAQIGDQRTHFLTTISDLNSAGAAGFILGHPTGKNYLNIVATAYGVSGDAKEAPTAYPSSSSWPSQRRHHLCSLHIKFEKGQLDASGRNRSSVDNPYAVQIRIVKASSVIRGAYGATIIGQDTAAGFVH